ncbi:hypothetical protein [Mucilaginibacter arboris]|uniref:Uncharacterized protein n=1 Tax=Mucilaginibacter arboris TaxID=2682090 RepID=A0A7K1T0H2_9SPHI|nr:hypothetical protein [Mucilaginibacter arboris]MVN23053.1 hypothetical protein [Mucilaginibacter arboris]
MKKLLLFCLSALALVSCKKSGNEAGPTSLPVTGNFTALNIKTNPQLVKLTVSSNKLNIVYTEDLTLVLDSNRLAQKCAVHLKEDFTGTTLANFDYQSLTKYGVNATNWVDDNLNNMVVNSSKDTLIAGKMFVKKRITRSFIYQKIYNSSDDASMALNQLLKQKDIITFSAYYAPTDTETAATSNTAMLNYVKM